MPKTHRDQYKYTGTNTEMYIKTLHELWPDLKICWFAVTRLGLQETHRSKKKILILIPEEKIFSHKYIVTAE